MSTTAYGLAYTQACSYVMGFLENIIDCESIGDIMGRVTKVAVLATIIIAVMVAGLAPIMPAAEDETVKVTVLGTYNFTSLTAYMYNTTSKSLLAVNTTYVKIEPNEIADLASDVVQPAVVLNLSAPTVDLNTNESIEYAWMLTNVYGDALVVAVVDINSTTNTVTNMEYYKISPATGDIAIVRTSYDILIEGNGYKLSIPLANFTDPKVLLMTDQLASVTVGSITALELRAITNPPNGFTLIRQGTGESTFTISASGTLSIWFDETHDGGDVDLFIFDSSNPHYADASNEQTWSWLYTYANRYLFADASPQLSTVTAHGTVKFVVKGYSGNIAGVQWRIAASLGNEHSNSVTTTQQPTTTSTTTSGNGINLAGLWHSIEGALGGSTIAIAIVIVLGILLLALALRR